MSVVSVFMLKTHEECFLFMHTHRPLQVSVLVLEASALLFSRSSEDSAFINRLSSTSSGQTDTKLSLSGPTSSNIYNRRPTPGLLHEFGLCLLISCEVLFF